MFGNAEWVMMVANWEAVFIKCTIVQAYSVMMKTSLDAVLAISFMVFTNSMAVLACFNTMLASMCVPKPFGDAPKPFGGVPKPFGDAPKPFGDVPKPFGGVPKPFGDVPKHRSDVDLG